MTMSGNTVVNEVGTCTAVSGATTFRLNQQRYWRCLSGVLLDFSKSKTTLPQFLPSKNVRSHWRGTANIPGAPGAYENQRFDGGYRWPLRAYQRL
jgi:hypothetical protein